MKNTFTNNFPSINIYKKKSIKSEIVSQIIFGQNFLIIKKSKKWLKIKVLDDGYKGFIVNKKYLKKEVPSHKVYKLKANIYSSPSRTNKIGQITFGSKIKAEYKKNRFIKFKNRWIELKDVKPINFKNKNIFKNLKIFLNVKYVWGGKSYKGIDCSALVQLFLNFNNKFCPRDAKDQVKYFRRNIELRNLKKNDVLYWKGHVAIALSKNNLIHAYGPKKNTVIMNIYKTIKLIKKTAKLKLLSVKRIV